jgi:hypothetical protein
MELNIQKSHVTGSTAIQEYSFGIKVTPKAFELMIAQLYKDRLAAFIRELSTNAYEAHQMVGTEHIPFDVTLPSLLQPSFKIRDYGPGLSPDEIKNVYVMLFASTKDTSNEMGGCFGLGSKSPFAYDPQIQFGVISWKDGIKYCYSVYKDEVGYPKMDLLHQERTTEHNGVEVSIPIKRGDHATIETKARDIYRWFKTTPKNIGNPRPFARCVSVMSGSNWAKYNELTHAAVKMGNIVYTIDSSLCNLHGLERYPILVEFPIGALTPEPSREGLSYDKPTKRAIEEAFKNIKAEMISKVQPKIDQCLDMYEAVLVARDLTNNSPMSLRDFKYKGQTIDDNFGYMKSEIGTIKTIVGDKLKVSNNTYVRPQQKPVFVVLDKKCAHNNFIKHHLRTNNLLSYGQHVYVCDVAYSKQSPEEFIKFFKIDKSRLLNVSAIPYVPPKRAPGTVKSNRHITSMFTWKYDTTNTHSWVDAKVDIKTETGYYVVYSANKIVTPAGEISPHKLQDLLTLIGFTGIIYGVKKASVDKVKATGNWKNFLDYAKPLAYNKLKSVNVDDARTATHVLQTMRYKNETSHDFVQKLVDTKVTVNHPDVQAAVDEYKKLELLTKIDFRVSEAIVWNFFGEKLSGSTAPSTLDSKKYEKLIAVLDTKFPLLTQVYDMKPSIVNELVTYITKKGI